MAKRSKLKFITFEQYAVNLQKKAAQGQAPACAVGKFLTEKGIVPHVSQ